jgi:hypothetical protein
LPIIYREEGYYVQARAALTPPKGGSSPTGQPQAAAASADMEQYSSDCELPPMNHKHDD